MLPKEAYLDTKILGIASVFGWSYHRWAYVALLESLSVSLSKTSFYFFLLIFMFYELSAFRVITKH